MKNVQQIPSNKVIVKLKAFAKTYFLLHSFVVVFSISKLLFMAVIWINSKILYYFALHCDFMHLKKNNNNKCHVPSEIPTKELCIRVLVRVCVWRIKIMAYLNAANEIASRQMW